MAAPQERVELEEFVEQVGRLYEADGLPRMAGRVVGWLLICDPAHQTMEQIGRAVHGSKGAMSTMTRLLVQVGVVERFRFPGERRDHFRVRPGMWVSSFREKLQRVTAAKELFAHGLELLSRCPSRQRERLQDAFELYRWLEGEVPKMLDRWKRQHRQAKSNHR